MSENVIGTDYQKIRMSSTQRLSEVVGMTREIDANENYVCTCVCVADVRWVHSYRVK